MSDYLAKVRVKMDNRCVALAVVLGTEVPRADS